MLRHDFDGEVVRALTGELHAEILDLGNAGPVLATGDAFVADIVARDALSGRADLVDMEGYAVARAARSLGVPVRLAKHLSDEADAAAGRSWQDTVVGSARRLAEWTDANL